MAERLEKLRIKNLDSGEQFFVLFNPSEYTVEDASHWADQDKMGQKPELHYTGGDRKKLTMELFFDTYEARTDVRQHTAKIAGLLVFNKEKHRPPKRRLLRQRPLIRPHLIRRRRCLRPRRRFSRRSVRSPHQSRPRCCAGCPGRPAPDKLSRLDSCRGVARCEKSRAR